MDDCEGDLEGLIEVLRRAMVVASGTSRGKGLGGKRQTERRNRASTMENVRAMTTSHQRRQQRRRLEVRCVVEEGRRAKLSRASRSW